MGVSTVSKRPDVDLGAAWRDVGLLRGAAYVGLAFCFVYGTKVLNKTFLPGLEDRPGFDVYDPLLEALPAMDVSWPIFFFMYSITVVGFALIGRRPYRLAMALFSYGFMYLFRFVCICLVPLNAPKDLVVLTDPIVDLLHLHDVFLRRDLFYSGHFASVFLLYLWVEKHWYRPVFLGFSLIVGVLILVQHIHYTYDIIGAAVFSYCSVYCAQKFFAKLVTF